MSAPPSGPAETPYYTAVQREAESIGNALINAIMQESDVEQMLLAMWIRNGAYEINTNHALPRSETVQGLLSTIKDIVSKIYDHVRYTHYAKDIEWQLDFTFHYYHWGFEVQDVIARYGAAENETKGPQEVE
jgi:hypothetical protein